MTDVDRTKQKFVSYDGDLADDAAISKKPETKKETPAAKEKLYERASDQPLSCPTDRSVMPGGPSYADYAKKAQPQETKSAAPVCDSSHTENCPSDSTSGSATVIKQTGARGVELVFGEPDPDTKDLVVRAEVGTQNELTVGTLEQKKELGKVAGIGLSVTQAGPGGGAHIGIHNGDGSTGFNIGAGAQVVSAGVVVERADGVGLSVAGSAGPSAGVSVGMKSTPNGLQACAEVEAFMFTARLCAPVPL